MQHNDELLWNLALSAGLMAKECWFVSKVYTSFWPKTNEFLFLFYSMFEKVFIVKPVSSPYLSEVKGFFGFYVFFCRRDSLYAKT